MPITFNIELNSRPTRDGLFSLLIRITENKVHRRIKVGFDIPKTDWDPLKQQVRKSHPNAPELNHLLKAKILELQKSTLQSQIHNTPLTIEDLQQGLKPRYEDFYDYYDKYLSRIPQNKHGTWRRMYYSLKSVQEFRPKLFFKDLTLGFILDYKAHLMEKGNQPNTIANNLGGIRVVLYQAYKELGITYPNPFMRLKLPTAKVRREKLTEEEIRKLEEVTLNPGSLLDTFRNMFLFAFYNQGIRVGDLLTLTPSNIKGGVLEYKMRKTGTLKRIPMIEKAQAIAELYCHPHYLFPVLPYHEEYTEAHITKLIALRISLFNTYLKRIAKKAGITKNLSTHISRHSFADIALEKGVGVYEISKMLGHSTVRVTEQYLSSDKASLSNAAMDRIFKES